MAWFLLPVKYIVGCVRILCETIVGMMMSASGSSGQMGEERHLTLTDEQDIKTENHRILNSSK